MGLALAGLAGADDTTESSKWLCSVSYVYDLN